MKERVLRPGPLKARYRHPAPDRVGADPLGDAVDKDVGVSCEDAEDEASSEDEMMPAEQARHQRVLVESSRRRKRHRGDGKTTDPNVLSLPERNAVGPATGEQYEQPPNRFLESAADRGADLDTDERVDKELVGDLNRKYLGGYDVSAGVALLAPWLHFFPLAEVQKRGRWKTLESVMRYEKARRRHQEMARLDPNLRRHPEECARRVGGCVRGRDVAPLPPRRR